MNEFNNLNLETCNNPYPSTPFRSSIHDAIVLTANTQRGDCHAGSDRGASELEQREFNNAITVVAEFDSEDDDGGDDTVPDTDFPPCKVAAGFPGYVDILSPDWICPCSDIVPGSDPNHFDGCVPESIPEPDPDYVAYSTAEDLSGGELLSDADFNAALESWPAVAEQLEASDTYLD